MKVILAAETDKLQDLCNLIQWEFIMVDGLEVGCREILCII